MPTKFQITGRKDKDVNWSQGDLDFQQACYGMSQSEMVDYLNANLRMVFKRTAEEAKSWLMYCMLSDVQEMMAHGDNEGARKLVNRVKFLINQTVEEVEADE